MTRSGHRRSVATGQRSAARARIGPRAGVVVVAGLLAVLAAAAVFARHEERPRAVIVDQLSLTHPNGAFVDAATGLLEGAGYDVDYLPGETVRVKRIQTLPERGYRLVVLRTHSARIQGAEGPTDDVALFTGEMIDLDRYRVSGVPPEAATAVARAIAERPTPDGQVTPEPTHSVEETAGLVPVFYDPHSGELPYFGVRPRYVEEELEGRFPEGTAVILMGCDGLRAPAMAEAFLSRGASTFVSWDAPVTAEHTDRATIELLRALVEDGLTPDEAVTRANAAAGPDPDFGARLVARTRPAP